jgi:hypothetical protein
LEEGNAATSFDFRDYGRELAMCQRYAYVNRLSQVVLLGLAGFLKQQPLQLLA